MVIGGKPFTFVNLDRRSVAMDHAQQAMIRASGVDQVLPEELESDEEWLLRVRVALIDSGRACDFVGTYLLPMGVTERDWSAEIGADTAEHLRQCTDAADRRMVDALALEVIFYFFQKGLDSLLTSRRYLQLTEPRPSNAAAPSRSAIGTASSGSSRITTMIARLRSLAGQCARFCSRTSSA